MHILLVEDHPGYREQIAGILQKQIADVQSLRTAASVGEALEQIKADHPLDLLLTDTQIKGGSCVDILCRTNRFDYHVVFMSTEERDYRVKAMISAGFPFYSKFTHTAKLIELILDCGPAKTLTSERVAALKKNEQYIAEGQRAVATQKGWLQFMRSALGLKKN